MWYVYMVECSGGRLYTGVTTDLTRRLKEHQKGGGAKFTRAFGAKGFRYTESCPDRGAAQRREAALKKMTRQEKMALIG